MALITLDEMANINIGVYSIEEIKQLSFYKSKIERIIDKYIPGKDDSLPQIYDLPEEISQDISVVSTYLATMSPKIGSLKGLILKLEEDKKVCLAINFKASSGSAKDKEMEARIKTEKVIQAYSRTTIAYESYKNFQYVVGNWIENMKQRIFILARELGREGHT